MARHAQGDGAMRTNHSSFVYSPRRYYRLLDWIMERGTYVEPRGMRTTEIMDAHLVVKDPRDRLIFDPSRKMNLAFAAADLIQILARDDDANWLSKFAANIMDFADEEGKIGGAYGPRLAPQLPIIESKLSKDSYTRQAVATIYRPQDLAAQPHMVPCTVSLQFLLREGRLHLITNMRSNDVVWGLTYDVFLFTMIQEMVARDLHVSLGEYHHNDGSLHFYIDRDDALLDKLSKKSYTRKMRAMDYGSCEPIDVYLAARSAEDMGPLFWPAVARIPDRVMRDLLAVIRHWFARKAGDFAEFEMAYKMVKDPAIRQMLINWPWITR